MQKPKLHKQEKSYSCSIACLKMVLEYWGIQESELQLRKKAKTKFYGTHPVNLIECARLYGLDAFLASLNLADLERLINQGIPTIANILKTKKEDFYIHSVVVYAIDENYVFFLDPEDGDIQLARDLFERLWQNNDSIAVVINMRSD